MSYTGSSRVSMRFRRRFFGGVVVWLNAERGPGITDLSGNGNHPTLNAAPTLTTGGPGGKRFWRWAGSQLITFPDCFSALTVAECFVVVKRSDNTSGHDGFWRFGASNDCRFPFPGDGGIYDEWGTSARKTTGVPTKSPVSDFIIYNVTSKSGGWTSRINGTQHFTTATNTVSFKTACEIGRNSAGGETFYGDVAELIIFNRELAAAERASVVADLTEEFRIV